MYASPSRQLDNTIISQAATPSFLNARNESEFCKDMVSRRLPMDDVGIRVRVAPKSDAKKEESWNGLSPTAEHLLRQTKQCDSILSRLGISSSGICTDRSINLSASISNAREEPRALPEFNDDCSFASEASRDVVSHANTSIQRAHFALAAAQQSHAALQHKLDARSGKEEGVLSDLLHQLRQENEGLRKSVTELTSGRSETSKREDLQNIGIRSNELKEKLANAEREVLRLQVREKVLERELQNISTVARDANEEQTNNLSFTLERCSGVEAASPENENVRFEVFHQTAIETVKWSRTINLDLRIELRSIREEMKHLDDELLQTQSYLISMVHLSRASPSPLRVGGGYMYESSELWNEVRRFVASTTWGQAAGITETSKDIIEVKKSGGSRVRKSVIETVNQTKANSHTDFSVQPSKGSHRHTHRVFQHKNEQLDPYNRIGAIEDRLNDQCEDLSRALQELEMWNDRMSRAWTRKSVDILNVTQECRGLETKLSKQESKVQMFLQKTCTRSFKSLNGQAFRAWIESMKHLKLHRFIRKNLRRSLKLHLQRAYQSWGFSKLVSTCQLSKLTQGKLRFISTREATRILLEIWSQWAGVCCEKQNQVSMLRTSKSKRMLCNWNLNAGKSQDCITAFRVLVNMKIRITKARMLHKVTRIYQYKSLETKISYSMLTRMKHRRTVLKVLKTWCSHFENANCIVSALALAKSNRNKRISALVVFQWHALAHSRVLKATALVRKKDSVCLSSSFREWLSAFNQIRSLNRSLRRVVVKLCFRFLVLAFQGWVFITKKLVHIRKKMRTMLGCSVLQVTLRALILWNNNSKTFKTVRNKHSAIVKRFSCQSVTRALNWWSFRVSENKKKCSALRKAAMKLFKVCLAGAYYAWMEKSKNALKLRNQTKAVVCRILTRTLPKAFNQWSWNVKDIRKSSCVLRKAAGKLFLRCLALAFNEWKSNIKEAAQVRRLQGAAVGRFLEQGVSRTFNQWKCNVHEICRIKSAMKKAAAKMFNMCLASAFNEWLLNSKYLKNAKQIKNKVLSRFLLRQAAKALRQWSDNVVEIKRISRIVCKVTARIFNCYLVIAFSEWRDNARISRSVRNKKHEVAIRFMAEGLSKAFNQWYCNVKEVRQTANVLRKAAAKMFLWNLATAFHQWEAGTQVSRHSRRQLRVAMKHYFGKGLSWALNQWYIHVSKIRRLPETLRKAAAKILNQKTASAFLTWASTTKFSRQIRTKLRSATSRVVLQLMSMAFQNWILRFANAVRLIQAENKVKSKIIKRLLSEKVRAWITLSKVSIRIRITIQSILLRGVTKETAVAFDVWGQACQTSKLASLCKAQQCYNATINYKLQLEQSANKTLIRIVCAWKDVSLWSMSICQRLKHKTQQRISNLKSKILLKWNVIAAFGRKKYAVQRKSGRSLKKLLLSSFSSWFSRFRFLKYARVQIRMLLIRKNASLVVSAFNCLCNLLHKRTSEVRKDLSRQLECVTSDLANIKDAFNQVHDSEQQARKDLHRLSLSLDTLQKKQAMAQVLQGFAGGEISGLQVRETVLEESLSCLGKQLNIQCEDLNYALVAAGNKFEDEQRIRLELSAELNRLKADHQTLLESLHGREVANIEATAELTEHLLSAKSENEYLHNALILKKEEASFATESQQKAWLALQQLSLSAQSTQDNYATSQLEIGALKEQIATLHSKEIQLEASLECFRTECLKLNIALTADHKQSEHELGSSLANLTESLKLLRIDNNNLERECLEANEQCEQLKNAQNLAAEQLQAIQREMQAKEKHHELTEKQLNILKQLQGQLAQRDGSLVECLDHFEETMEKQCEKLVQVLVATKHKFSYDYRSLKDAAVEAVTVARAISTQLRSAHRQRRVLEKELTLSRSHIISVAKATSKIGRMSGRVGGGYDYVEKAWLALHKYASTTGWGRDAGISEVQLLQTCQPKTEPGPRSPSGQIRTRNTPTRVVSTPLENDRNPFAREEVHDAVVQDEGQVEQSTVPLTEADSSRRVKFAPGNAGKKQPIHRIPVLKSRISESISDPRIETAVESPDGIILMEMVGQIESRLLGLVCNQDDS